MRFTPRNTGTLKLTSGAGDCVRREEAGGKALVRGTRTVYEAADACTGEGARKPKARRSSSGGGCRDGGWMGRTSRVLPREPCTPARELNLATARRLPKNLAQGGRLL